MYAGLRTTETLYDEIIVLREWILPSKEGEEEPDLYWRTNKFALKRTI